MSTEHFTIKKDNRLAGLDNGQKVIINNITLNDDRIIRFFGDVALKVGDKVTVESEDAQITRLLINGEDVTSPAKFRKA